MSSDGCTVVDVGKILISTGECWETAVCYTLSLHQGRSCCGVWWWWHGCSCTLWKVHEGEEGGESMRFTCFLLSLQTLSGPFHFHQTDYLQVLFRKREYYHRLHISLQPTNQPLTLSIKIISQMEEEIRNISQMEEERRKLLSTF